MKKEIKVIIVVFDILKTAENNLISSVLFCLLVSIINYSFVRLVGYSIAKSFVAVKGRTEIFFKQYRTIT